MDEYLNSDWAEKAHQIFKSLSGNFNKIPKNSIWQGN
jgi:hypothetical protein